jgi:tetratricopeptide (TPR) repeat protein
MTEAPLNHPDDETLRALSLGQLTEADLTQISAHLGSCPACCRRIDQLATDDRLVARLQQGADGREEVLVSPAQRRPAVRALRRSHEDRSAARQPDPEALPMIVPASGRVGDCASLVDMRPVLLPEAEAKSDRFVGPRPDVMPRKSGTGDRYQLFGEIARGGMGAVLRGRDLDLGRNLAVKVLLERHAHLPEVARRFVEEAQIGGQLQHPGVVPVYDIGRFGDRPFFTMKLVEGMTLAAILSEREQPTDDRPRLLSIALQVAQAVAYAHAKGVVHRDLKPANIMVGAFGEVQVMDWGLAKVLAEGDVADEDQAARQQQPEKETTIRTARSGPVGTLGRETEVGSILGTPAYMPPEQAQGDIARLDRRADVFGLGAILCEVLTGLPPYVGPSIEEVQRKAASGDLVDAHARLDGCGAHQDLIVLTKWCLAPEAINRPRDAQGVADGLSEYLNGVQERLQATERERTVALVRAREERKRRKVQLALAAALVGLLVGGGAFAFWRNEQAQAGRERDARNAEAVAALLRQSEVALQTNNAAKAAVALEAAKKRFAEGGAQEHAEQLGRLEADLALVRDLDAVDQFRWTLVEDKFPHPAVVATRTQTAFRRFGADPYAVPVEEAAARVSTSVASARVVAALDRLLRHEKSAVVRTLLRRVDADPYRDAVRDAILADNGAKVVELAGRKAALDQSPGFVAFLGESGDIPVERRRQLLQAAVGRRPEDLGLLMTLGYTYRTEQEVGSNECRCWFQAAVAAAPANAAAHNSLGLTLKARGQLDEAIASWKQAIALDPKFAMARVNLGNVLRAQGEVDAAIACYQEALELDPKFAGAHTGLGLTLYDKGQVDAAIACYQTALEFDPKFVGAYVNLGTALKNKGQVDAAIACYEKAIELAPKLAVAHSGLGNARRAKGQIDAAIACYEKAIELAPKVAQTYINLGGALAGKGQVDAAIACVQKALELDPKDAEFHYSLGVALARKGQLDAAIACYQKAIYLDPKLARAHNNLGSALAGKGQVDAAIACFRRAVTLDPKVAGVHTNLGGVLARKGQLDAAIACYRKAIDLAPKLARAHNNLGGALADKGQVDAAIACFQKALELDPKDAEAHYSLGAALHGKGQVDAAIACYQKAIDLDPKLARAHNNLGSALARKGQMDAAIACFRRAVTLDPKVAGVHTNLGTALARKGQLDAAIACYENALAIDRNYARARVQLAKAKQLVVIWDKLAAFRNGTYTPATPSEYLDLARWCQVNKLHHTAAGLYAAAFADLRLADDLKLAHRYGAACHAALAAAGQGVDAAKLDEKDRTRLRQQALAWLRADLAQWAKRLETGKTAARGAVQSALRHWQQDRDLAGIRDAAALATLPAAEQKACTQLWADVAALLKKAKDPSN